MRTVVILIVIVVAVFGLLKLFNPDPRTPSQIIVRLPALPVRVTQSHSKVGIGKVVHFHNESPNQLVVSVHITPAIGDSSHHPKDYQISMEPNGTSSIGWNDGWMFDLGETVRVTHPGYRGATYVVSGGGEMNQLADE